jgi:predicted enzyme related to lactoylglutathione lyase
MAKVGQIAIWVDDLDKAMKDYEDVFGMTFRVTEAEFINMRVAQSDNGLVLATKLDPSKGSDVEGIWNKPLLAMEIQVDDIEVTRKMLEERGTKPIYYAEAGGGMKEYFTDQLHGIPLTIFQMDSSSWLDATSGNAEMPGLKVEWVNHPKGK